MNLPWEVGQRVEPGVGIAAGGFKAQGARERRLHEAFSLPRKTAESTSPKAFSSMAEGLVFHRSD